MYLQKLQSLYKAVLLACLCSVFTCFSLILISLKTECCTSQTGKFTHAQLSPSSARYVTNPSRPSSNASDATSLAVWNKLCAAPSVQLYFKSKITETSSNNTPTGSNHTDDVTSAFISTRLASPKLLSPDSHNNCFKRNTSDAKCTFDITSCLSKQHFKQFKPDLAEKEWQQLVESHDSMQMGSWAPCECVPTQNLAIVVPYRHRLPHLHVFLNNIIPFLQFQRQAFTIFIVEQTPDIAFNRAALFNAALLEIDKLDVRYDCVIIHDVDSIPENMCTFYHCPEQPLHMSALRTKNAYALPYDKYLGGVVAISQSILTSINGMSNLFFGWGQEDDNLFGRFELKKASVARFPSCLSRFYSLPHGDMRAMKGRTTRMVSIQFHLPLLTSPRFIFL